PPFPQGISFDRESGVISGSPSEATIEIRHTIVASNAVGSTSTWIDLEVTIEGPKSITYAESILDCELGHQCQLAAPSISGGDPDYWSVDPRLPDGISLLADGSIDGSPTQLGDSNHTITISNEGGSVETAIRIIVLHEAPMGLGYGGNRFILSIGDDVQVVPITTGGRIVSWSVEPPLPDGLQLLQADGSIRGSPTTVQSLTPHRVTATNTGGSISVDVLISVVDIPVSNLIYTPDEYDLTIGDEITVTPTHSGGIPDSWQIEPELPPGFTFDSTNGTISGTATDLQVDWSSFTIWANNTGGSASTSFRIRITSLAPDLISWAQTEYALASNESAFIAVTNNGPAIDSWEIEPALPDGLVIIANGSIEGTPTHNIDWTEFTIWANNTGGSVGLNIWIVVHDLRADQSELLSGLDDADWGGWSSLILPIGKWSFPLGRDTTDSTVVAASHVGRGKMIGLGHESWVTQNHEFNFRAVEWVCGEAANVGLAYGAGFDHWEDELQAEGHSVHLSVTPDDLSQVDCLLDEFWNGHDDDDNLAIEQFLLGGGGVIMGGHAWYWSYSNSDVPHNYPGNKISKITGLMVSSDWGYNDIDFEIPDLMYTPHNAIRGIFADRVDGIELTEEEAAIAYSSISDCTVIVPLDFLEFWTPLRKLVNSTGWTVIPYSTLWSSTGHELGADPVADVILRLEEALTQNLPADELPVHPSHTEFPGEVPSNATRISRTVSINGTQPGLPSNFGYSGARSSLRMSTGLYAPPGEVITVSVSQDVSELGFWILIGAHTDGLWGKDVIKRHSKIYRYWWIENTTTEIGNAFGGPIYAAIPAGSEFGEFDMTISGAVRAPMFVLGETSDFEWIYSERDNPAPWTELVSNNFIMTVPTSEIRNLNNPTELMDWWDQALEMEHELYGYLPWPRVERAVFDAQISAGWMHSGYPFMAHDLSVAGVVNSSYMSENGDWGMFHELGHNHQWMPSTLPGTTETGCNFASVYLMEELVGVEGHGAVDPAQRESRMRDYFDDGSNIANWSVWIALDTYLIIKEEWGWEPITEALSVYYTLPSAEVPVGDTEEFNAWVMHLSNATGYNLAPYHAAWGFPLTQDTFDSLSHLPIWVDDPLRGEYFVYDAMLRNIGANSTTSSTADFAWETYDNGTNTTLTLYWGTTDMGNQSWVWGNNANLGDSEVGWGEYEVTGLSSGTTYYARVKASNEERDTWFGPVSWTTST
ncbi:M60 family metallopeptidase, partial [Candidatus Poseidoniales archaeon]|nr:M60 family metallopeptidase [Candidatus Poseidoniales archaeon]